MSAFLDLMNRAEQAERPARQGFDALTRQRLLEASKDYRDRAKALQETGPDRLN